ncbi:MAG: hypothetical protein BYD32DRAFT_488733 [Podila humilis]|nr:MAG: hypothetical protein BYD32DRAFT_488733 [Podila humilis]
MHINNWVLSFSHPYPQEQAEIMFANKTFLFAIAAFMILATAEAAPASLQGCVPCPQWPICPGRCPPGHWCDFDECTCTIVCQRGDIP